MDAALEIENYIETKENSGALLITGQWGCGKSYIVRQVAETLNREHPELSDTGAETQPLAGELLYRCRRYL